MTRTRTHPPPPAAKNYSTTVHRTDLSSDGARSTFVRSPPPPGTLRSSHTHQTQSQQSQSPTPNGAHTMAVKPGMMHQVATIAAGSAIGHVAGVGISNMMLGGRTHRDDERAVAVTPTVVPAQATTAACASEHVELGRCLKETNGNISLCQSYVDMLQRCFAHGM
jgi:hypothetical protein